MEYLRTPFMHAVHRYRSSIVSIARLAFPITMGQLSLVLMGFADVVMLGRYNTSDMSAAGVGNAVFYLFSLIGVGTLYGLSTIVSIADGEGKPQQSVPAFRSSLWATFILSAVLMLINEFLYRNFDIFEQSASITAKAADYLRIVNYSVPGLLLFNNGKQVLDGLGRTAASMYVTMAGLLCNVLLNYLFIYGKGGFPEMGLQGAALATLISRYVMAIWMLLAAWFHPLLRQYRKNNRAQDCPEEDRIQDRSYLWPVFRIGLPVGFTYFFEIAAFSYALIMAGQISDIHSGAHQIAINLASVTYMFVMGISAACGIVVGNSYGARDREGVRRSGIAAILLTIIIESVFAVFFFVFNKQLPLLYTEDSSILAIAPGLLILAAFFQIGDGLQAVGAGALRGIKDTRVTGLIAFVSYWLIMMPGAWYLCFRTELGIYGIWIAFVAGLSFAALCLLYRFFKMTGPGMEFGDET